MELKQLNDVLRIATFSQLNSILLKSNTIHCTCAHVEVTLSTEILT